MKECNIYFNDRVKKRKIKVDSSYQDLRDMIKNAFDVGSSQFYLKYCTKDSGSFFLNDQEDFKQMMKVQQLLRIYVFTQKEIQTSSKTCGKVDTQNFLENQQDSNSICKDSIQSKIETAKILDYRPLLRQLINNKFSDTDNQRQPLTSSDILNQNENFKREMDILNKKFQVILSQNLNNWQQQFLEKSKSKRKQMVE